MPRTPGYHPNRLRQEKHQSKLNMIFFRFYVEVKIHFLLFEAVKIVHYKANNTLLSTQNVNLPRPQCRPLYVRPIHWYFLITQTQHHLRFVEIKL